MRKFNGILVGLIILVGIAGGVFLMNNNNAQAGPCSPGSIYSLRASAIGQNSIVWSWRASGTCGYYHITEVDSPTGHDGVFGTQNTSFTQKYTGYNGLCDRHDSDDRCLAYSVRRSLRSGERVCIRVHQASFPAGYPSQSPAVGPESYTVCATTADLTPRAIY